MRSVGIAAAILFAGGPALAASPEAQAYVAVDECISQSQAVDQAAEARDLDSTIFNIQQARLLCTRAASKLRSAKFAGLDSRMAADGLDQVVAGLERAETALRLRDHDPERASRELEAATQLLQAGIDKFEQAS